MLQLSDQGEVALKLGFDGNKELEIQGYYFPKKEQFTGTEIKEAYVAGSLKQLRRKDKAASNLFKEFTRASAEPKNYEVFTWSSADMNDNGEVAEPEVPAPESHERRAEQGRDSRTVHVLHQGEVCSCKERLDFVSGKPTDKSKPESKREPSVFEALSNEIVSVFAGKKYKPVGLKVRPV